MTRNKLLKYFAQLNPFTCTSIIKHNLTNGITIDIGSGTGKTIEFIGREYFYVLIGGDIYLPSLKKSKEKQIYDSLIRIDIRYLPFKTKIANNILCIEVLEHLTHEEGLNLLKNFECLAKDKIFITTPLGYLPQGRLDENDYQVHKSGWLPEDFKRLGYSVIPIEFSFPNYKRDELKFLFILRSIFTTVLFPLMLIYPKTFCGRILCIKHIT